MCRPDGSTMGERNQVLGRGALLAHASKKLVKPGLGLGQYYKPVSVDDLPSAPPAIPGECSVQDSWKCLSRAPVAYQMQQVLKEEEDRCEGRKEEEDCCEGRKEEEQPQNGAMSIDVAHLPSTKQVLCNRFSDFKQHCQQKLHGSRIVTSYAQKVQGKQVSWKRTKDGSVNPLWDPLILDKDHFQVPDLASDVDFPELVPSKGAVKKKI